jgi:hypothetical protein
LLKDPETDRLNLVNKNLEIGWSLSVIYDSNVFNRTRYWIDLMIHLLTFSICFKINQRFNDKKCHFFIDISFNDEKLNQILLLSKFISILNRHFLWSNFHFYGINSDLKIWISLFDFIWPFALIWRIKYLWNVSFLWFGFLR